jgi:DNA (cytosine-5)-methyltransferase 1
VIHLVQPGSSSPNLTGGFANGRRINLETRPCPTVTTSEIAGFAYWLEDDGRPVPERPEKPPYRVPAVSELPEPGPLVCASTFSGCGGSCLGYRMAGYDVRFANEIAPLPRRSYAANFGSEPDPRDVRTVTAEDVLEALGMERGELDLLDGSPPCTPFSMAGKRQRGWRVEVEHAGHKQRVDDLFLEYARLVDGLRPRAFVAENVAGLVRGAAKGYFKMIHRALSDCGYRVEARLLDAQWLGVPQQRVRLFLVGVREDVGEPAFPTPLPHRYSVRDAIPGLSLGSAEGLDLDGYAIGRELDALRPGEQSDRYFSLRRADPDRPSPTAIPPGQDGSPLGAATVAHPTERRKFTIAELKRVSGLPDDFVLEGTYGQQWAQCGNLVCPPVARAVGEALLPVLSRRREPAGANDR